MSRQRRSQSTRQQLTQDGVMAIAAVLILGLITMAFALRTGDVEQPQRAELPEAAESGLPNTPSPSPPFASNFEVPIDPATSAQTPFPELKPIPPIPELGGVESTPEPLGSQPLAALSSNQPLQAKAFIDPSNYGQRMAQDINGQAVNHDPLVVLHETVGSARSAINTFQVPHEDEHNQVSYHALILLDGTIVYLLGPEQRAYGAGNSVFEGPKGPEAVQTNPNFPPSVNNFAYHISLETPPDGNHNEPSHSGYSEAQYESLAWLVARTNVTEERITTHAAIDRSGERQDPRSFNKAKFLSLLNLYR